MSFDYGALGDAIGGISKGVGGLFQSAGYEDAAKLDDENARLSKLSTGIQLTQADREAYQVIGKTEAVAGSNGFSLSGSSLDVLRDNTRQLSLNKNLAAEQGAIETNSWAEKAGAERGAAAAAQAGGIGGILGGIAGIAGLF